MKTTVKSKYSLLDGFVHFSTFRLTLSELVLSVQHSHCLKIQCSEPFLSAGSVIYSRQQSIPLFQPTEIRFGGTVSRNQPTWSSVSTGVQVHFHRSLSLYFSIRHHHSLQKCKDASFQLVFHLAKHFTPTYGVKTADNNFLRSGRDNNIRRGTLLVSGVYLNNFSFIICFTPSPLYAIDMTFKAFQKASNFILLDSVFPLALQSWSIHNRINIL